MIYKLAGEYFRFSCTSERLFYDFEPFRFFPKNENIINISFDIIEFKCFCEKYKHLDKYQCEKIFSLQKFFIPLLHKRKLLIHATAISINEQTVLILGEAGVGKSTFAKQWVDFGGNKVYLINDDRTIIARKGSRLFAYISPWSSFKNGISDVGYPIKSLIILLKGQKYQLENMSINSFCDIVKKFYPNEYKNKVEILLKDLILDVGLWMVQSNIKDVNFEEIQKVMKIGI